MNCRLFLILLACFMFLSIEPLAAQPLRRYRVGAPPLRFGERPLGQRLAGALQMFAEGGKELRPFLVASLTSYDDFKASVLTMAEQNRAPHGGAEPVRLQRVLELYESLIAVGLDTSQPIGAILLTDGLRLFPIFFSPVDVENRQIAGFLKNGLIVDMPDGRRMLNTERFRWPFGNLYMVERNGWLFVAMEEQLAALPNDPTPLLQGLEKKHLLALKFDFTHMPPLVTNIGLTMNEMSQLNKATDDVERAGIRIQSEFLRTASQQCDGLLLAVDYEPEGNDLVFRMVEEIKPETARDRRRQLRAAASSPLHGFYRPEGAVAAMHLFTALTPLQQSQLRVIAEGTVGKTLADALEAKSTEAVDPEAPPSPAPPTGRLEMFTCGTLRIYYETLLAAIDAGLVDLAFTFSQEQGLIAAFHVTDTQGIAATLEAHFADFADRYPESYERNVKYRYGELDGFQFTSVRVDLQEIAATPAGALLNGLGNAFAEKRDIHFLFAVRDETLCLAVGREDWAEQRLSAAIVGMREEQPVPADFFVYSGYELGNLIANLGHPDRLAAFKVFAASGDPRARIVGTLINQTPTSDLAFRVNGMMIPSLWKIGERLRDATATLETPPPLPKSRQRLFYPQPSEAFPFPTATR